MPWTTYVSTMYMCIYSTYYTVHAVMYSWMGYTGPPCTKSEGRALGKQSSGLKAFGYSPTGTDEEEKEEIVHISHYDVVTLIRRRVAQPK